MDGRATICGLVGAGVVTPLLPPPADQAPGQNWHEDSGTQRHVPQSTCRKGEQWAKKWWVIHSSSEMEVWCLICFVNWGGWDRPCVGLRARIFGVEMFWWFCWLTEKAGLSNIRLANLSQFMTGVLGYIPSWWWLAMIFWSIVGSDRTFDSGSMLSWKRISQKSGLSQSKNQSPSFESSLFSVHKPWMSFKLGCFLIFNFVFSPFL